jgi:hypothetical protein
MVGARGLAALALGGDVDACRHYLHGPCFEATPVPRRSSTSSRESTASDDRHAADRLAAERRRQDLAAVRFDAKTAALEATRVETARQAAALRRKQSNCAALKALEAVIVEREARCADAESSFDVDRRAAEAVLESLEASRRETARLEEVYGKAIAQRASADERRKGLTKLRRADKEALDGLRRELSAAKRALKSKDGVIELLEGRRFDEDLPAAPPQRAVEATRRRQRSDAGTTRAVDDGGVERHGRFRDAGHRRVPHDTRRVHAKRRSRTRPGARWQAAETRRGEGTRRRCEEEEARQAIRGAAAARRAAAGRGAAHAAGGACEEEEAR